MDRDAHGITNAPGEYTDSGSVGVEFEDVGAVPLVRVAIRIVDVRVRAHRHIHFLPIEREGDIARPMAPASQASASGKVEYDYLPRTARLEVTVLISEPHHGTSVRNVDVTRIRPRRIERD